MSLPAGIRNTLRYGESLAATVPPLHSGWHAWVYVEPQINDTQDNTRFPLPLNKDARIKFSVRRVEISDWHLHDRWGWDMDVAIAERPILDEFIHAADEAALERVLAEWSCNPSDLKLPDQVGYPYPPRTDRGRINMKQ